MLNLHTNHQFSNMFYLPDQVATAMASMAALTRSPKVQAGIAALAVLGTLA